MAKITQAQFNKYKAINENGFKINLNKLMNQFSHGDEFPQLSQVIYNDEDKQIILTVSFFKFYNNSAEYRIEVNEFKKSKDNNYFLIGGTGCYNKELYKEDIISPARFNLNKLLSIAKGVNVLEIKKNTIKELSLTIN